MAFVVVLWLLRRVSATRTVLLEYLSPPIGVMASVIVLGESLTWSIFVGGLLILSGVFLASGTRLSPRPTERRVK
jgi:drug/metabolite transporter (DMT)-like permease